MVSRENAALRPFPSASPLCVRLVPTEQDVGSGPLR